MPNTDNLTKAFSKWLWDINGGRRFMYYKGFLAKDRWNNWQLETPTVNRPVDDLAKAAWGAYEAGLVHLTQSRVGDDEYAYWATKTKEFGK
jgi:hypothetical protein